VFGFIALNTMDSRLRGNDGGGTDNDRGVQ